MAKHKAVWLALLLCSGAATYAQESNEPEPEKSAGDWSDRIILRASYWLVDAFRNLDDYLYTKLNRGVIPAEELLHDPKLTDFDQGSHIVLSPYVRMREGGEWDGSVRFSARIKLPRVSDRLELVFDNTQTEEDVLPELLDAVQEKDRQNDSTRLSEADSLQEAGLRYSLFENVRFKLSLDGSIRFTPNPNPRIGFRTKLHKRIGEWNASYKQRVYYQSGLGFGEQSKFTFTHSLPGNCRFNSTSTFNWTEKSEGLEFGQSLDFLWHLSDRRVVGPRFTVVGHGHPSVEFDGFSTSFRFRRKVSKDWLFMTLEPGMEFIEEEDFETKFFCFLKFDITIGDYLPSSEKIKRHKRGTLFPLF